MAIHEWVFKLASWSEAARPRGRRRRRRTRATRCSPRPQENIGAVVMGRNMFGPVRGPWPDKDWKGWWGDDPPFHCPVYVLTHHPRDPFELENGNSFHFVTEGIEAGGRRSQGGGRRPGRLGRRRRLDRAADDRRGPPRRDHGHPGRRSSSAAASGSSTTSRPAPSSPSWPPWSRAPTRSTSPTASAERRAAYCGAAAGSRILKRARACADRFGPWRKMTPPPPKRPASTGPGS